MHSAKYRNFHFSVKKDLFSEFDEMHLVLLTESQFHDDVVKYFFLKKSTFTLPSKVQGLEHKART